MQRRTPDGIIIACDFCGRDWDPSGPAQVNPMIEGHEGSVLCLACLQAALGAAEPAGERFTCTMCLRELGPDKKRWQPAPRAEAANPAAVICSECARQAAVAFDRDDDVDWKMPR